MLSPDFFCVNPIDLNRAYPERGAMSEMRYACTKSLLLPVTRYCKVRNAVVPSLWVRSAFAMASLFLRSWDYRINGPRTDLQRTWNGPASLCNFRNVLPSRQYIEGGIVIPAHPRYTRMYGVTHSIAFQANSELAKAE